MVSRITVVTVKKKVTPTALQNVEPRLPGGHETVVPFGPAHCWNSQCA